MKKRIVDVRLLAILLATCACAFLWAQAENPAPSQNGPAVAKGGSGRGGGGAPVGPLPTGPDLGYKYVPNWPQLPAGWTYGEVEAVDLDPSDNLWVLTDGEHKVMEFDRSGKFLRTWAEWPGKSPHGIRVGPDGNIWTIDNGGDHKIMEFTPDGRLLMSLGTGNAAPDNDSKDSFNRPATIKFGPNGDFFVADGYGNSRVVRFSKDGKYLGQWGTKGTADGQFNLVHDVAFDSKGRIYVTDRNNHRVQIFDKDGKYLDKWPDLGSVQGLYYVKKEDAMYLCAIQGLIWKMSMDGKIIGMISSPDDLVPQRDGTLGKIGIPHYIAVDSTGAVIEADFRNWQVGKFVKK